MDKEPIEAVGRNEVPDTWEAVASDLVRFSTANPDCTLGDLARWAIHSDRKALANAIPRWDSPEGKPIPFNFHKDEEAIHAYVEGFNKARYLFLGEYA